MGEMEDGSDGTSAGYILRALASGLSLEAAESVQGQARRPSLTQRLGIQADQAGSETEGPSRSASPSGAGRARIECVEVVGPDVYVGTNTGQILHYTAGAAELEKDSSEHLLVQAVDLQVGARRVEQILAFPGLCRLVVLCGSVVSFLTLPELSPAPGVAQIKGVSCMGHDERAGREAAVAAGLCVARMREIRVYRLGSADVRLEQEIPIRHSVASICQYGGFICMADTETYKILDLSRVRRGAPEEGQLELLPTQQPYTDAEGRMVRPPRPRTLVVGVDEFMFLTASGDEATLGVIVTAQGEAQRGTLQFASYPRAIVYDEPYVVAAFASGRVEAYDSRAPDPMAAQVLLEDAQRMRLSLAARTEVATRVSRLEVIDTETPEAFAPHRVGPLDQPWTDAFPDAQWRWEAVVGAKQPGAGALSRWAHARAVAATQDTVYALARPPLLVRVDNLLRAQRVEEAIRLVEEAGLDDSPEAAYCLQVAGAVSLKATLVDDALEYFRRGRLDPRALLHLYPEYVEYLGAQLTPFVRVAMASGLRQQFYEMGSVDHLAGQDPGLRDALAANLNEMLERYLEFSQAQQAFVSEAGHVIDTALARLYAVSGQQEKLVALVRGSARIMGDVTCEFYRGAGYHYYCSLVLKARGDAPGVLAIWHGLLDGTLEDERFGGLEEYLWYVEHADSQRVLAEEFSWLVTVNVEAALRVLGHLDDSSVCGLDADAAISAVEGAGDKALRTFIERLLAAHHPRATHYMTYLLCVYVRQIRDQEELVARFHCAQAEDLTLTFRAFLKRQSGESAELRGGLVRALCARPPGYNAAAVLECVESEALASLALERAILLVVLGRVDEAVRLLVDSGDYAEAELLLLCPNAPQSLAHVLGVPESTPGTFAARVRQLLRMYLRLPEEEDDMAARLVSSLLVRYARHIPMEVLEEIPSHWPYALVEPFVRQCLEILGRQERLSKVAHALSESRGNGDRAEEAAVLGESGPLVLDYSQTCAKCKKLLGSSAFVYMPEPNEIRHVSCG
ncbi:hypothetical protein GGF46_001684 [Coemansia sp. RSA 552]|nr:hypothetical protein GGF46_001684 [Coemansia sp. RSA 552]